MSVEYLLIIKLEGLKRVSKLLNFITYVYCMHCVFYV